MLFVEYADTQMLSIPPEPQTFSITNEGIPAHELRNVGNKRPLFFFLSLSVVRTPSSSPHNNFHMFYANRFVRKWCKLSLRACYMA